MSSQKHSLRMPPAVILAATVAAIVGAAALTLRVGSDAQWLAALGHDIIARHAIPAGVPFAAAPTSHWQNVLVLGELVFHGLEQAFGPRGLMLAQLLAAGGALAILARDARAGDADAQATSGALLITAVGAFPALAIARVQLFSLVLFPLVVALLRAETRRPSRRIWLVLPLLALWSNLHGAAVLGLAVTIAYLLLERRRQQPLVALGVGIAAPFAICLTPALGGTIGYYHGVFTNLAAQRGLGLWGPLSASSPADIVLVVAAVALAVWAWRARPPLWETVSFVTLAAFTIHADRSGVWLLFFLAPLAARGIRSRRTWAGLVPLAAGAAIAALVVGFVRGPITDGAGRPLLARALVLAHGSPVLATDDIAEQVELAGGRVWVSDPIDAFSHRDQAAYLEWLQGVPSGRLALNGQVHVVLVSRGSRSQALMRDTPGFVVAGGDPTSELFTRAG